MDEACAVAFPAHCGDPIDHGSCPTGPNEGFLEKIWSILELWNKNNYFILSCEQELDIHICRVFVTQHNVIKPRLHRDDF